MAYLKTILFNLVNQVSFPKGGVSKCMRTTARNKPLVAPILMYTFVKCQSLEKPELKALNYKDRPLTHEYLIKQACSSTVNATSQILTQTLTAIMDTAQLYRDAMLELLKLLDETLEKTKNGISQEDLNDKLVMARAKVNDLNNSYMEFFSLMKSVENLVKTTAETAFVAGADPLCNMISDRLNYALAEINNDKTKNKELEEECLKLQQQIVYETAESIKRAEEREEQKKQKRADEPDIDFNDIM